MTQIGAPKSITPGGGDLRQNGGSARLASGDSITFGDHAGGVGRAS